MTQSESVGGVQERTAEVRDLGMNSGCDGAEGGSKVINSLHFNALYKSKQVSAYIAEIYKNVSYIYFSIHTNISKRKS